MSALAAITENYPAHRRVVEGDSPLVLSEIYQQDVNLVIWRRGVTAEVAEAAAQIIGHNEALRAELPVSAQNASAELLTVLSAQRYRADASATISADCAELVDMFCCLFDLSEAGLRLGTLDRAMCPKFHVDRVPCRLITTYHGCGSEWLPNSHVNRLSAGTVEPVETDEQSPDYYARNRIQTLNVGDVALLKGETWPKNQNAGLVHRSPALNAGERRLILTLDFTDAG